MYYVLLDMYYYMCYPMQYYIFPRDAVNVYLAFLSFLLQKRRPEVCYKKGVLQNWTKFTGNTCVEVFAYSLQHY